MGVWLHTSQFGLTHSLCSANYLTVGEDAGEYRARKLLGPSSLKKSVKNDESPSPGDKTDLAKPELQRSAPVPIPRRESSAATKPNTMPMDVVDHSSDEGDISSCDDPGCATPHHWHEARKDQAYERTKKHLGHVDLPKPEEKWKAKREQLVKKELQPDSSNSSMGSMSPYGKRSPDEASNKSLAGCY